MSTTLFSSGWIDEDLLDVKSLLQDFFIKEVAPLEEKLQAQGFPDKELHGRAGLLGLCGRSIPEEQKKRWLSRMCSGEWVGAIAMTEPGTGSDPHAITTRGFTRGRKLDKIGLTGQDTSELFFDRLRVPAAHVMGGGGPGLLPAREPAAAGTAHHCDPGPGHE
ncbi:hypothetical protein AAGW05_00225 [Arthrobacter sp. LAPM80]|uniref:hypothetical protein n=1 Tax=Arthrobacter sp. LAPM80 TaxID=3141788 RepID=UPI00398AC1F4